MDDKAEAEQKIAVDKVHHAIFNKKFLNNKLASTFGGRVPNLEIQDPPLDRNSGNWT